MTVELALLRSAKPEIDPSPGGPEPARRAPRAGAGRQPAGGDREAGRGREARRCTAAPAAKPTASAPPEEPVEAETTDAADATDPARKRPARSLGRRWCPDLGRVVELWPGVLDQMRQEGAGMLSAVVGAARPVAVDPESGR